MTDERREPEVVNEATPARRPIKVAELGRRPKQISLPPNEESRSIRQLIEEGSLRSNMEYFVNGQRVTEDMMVYPGDAVVSVPRIAAGS